ncbi:MAG: hypothetical protein CMD29_01225 [Flavobacteriales bacterium]|nr:hypothetical protein [Flavobacteriales bacterium]|tara:strand:- start:417 stop:869 length:453 start_codon:yes stop_codon:yes gene_type:complete
MSKKYILKDELESDFDLIAIHSSIEGFYLAYLLNRTLEGNFIKVANDEVLNSSDFEFFKWEIKKKGIHCTLISNEKTIKLKKSNSLLFFFEETKKVSLINSLKNVNYFIKINSGLEISDVFEKIKSLPQIVLTYIINNKKIKSKLNLILD